jgi:hypothetical protein
MAAVAILNACAFTAMLVYKYQGEKRKKGNI